MHHLHPVLHYYYYYYDDCNDDDLIRKSFRLEMESKYIYYYYYQKVLHGKRRERNDSEFELACFFLLLEETKAGRKFLSLDGVVCKSFYEKR